MSINNTRFNLGLIGCGPHAHRVYLKLIEKYLHQENIYPSLLVDLKSQRKKVKKYLEDINYQFEELIFLDDFELSSEYFTQGTKNKLQSLVLKHKLDGIIISTEPKSHKKYCLLALENDLSILVDKPITSPLNASTSPEGALKIEEDFLEILEAKKKSTGKVIIQCQRRYHDGYKFLLRYLDSFISQYKIPMTYIDIFHGDGCWVLPNEFYERENHPYKYGYGKLMHSGYHFVDLLAWLLMTNRRAIKYDSLEVFAKPLKPSDLNAQIHPDFFKQTFGINSLKSIYKDYELYSLNKFGEVDTYCKLFLYDSDSLITSCNLDLLQNSFSRRAWTNLPLDTYKGNGRVRHERVNIEVGPLLNIQVHSYQAYEPRHPESITGVGNEDHFEITIYRNTALVNGNSLEKYDFGESDRERYRDDKYYLGHNERARDIAFLNFIHKNDEGATLEEQAVTIELLKLISLSLAKSYSDESPLIESNFSLKNYEH